MIRPFVLFIIIPQTTN